MAFYGHDVGFKRFPVYGLVAHLVAVGINGADRIMQNPGYACAFLYPELDEGVYPQFGETGLRLS